MPLERNYKEPGVDFTEGSRMVVEMMQGKASRASHLTKKGVEKRHVRPAAKFKVGDFVVAVREIALGTAIKLPRDSVESKRGRLNRIDREARGLLLHVSRSSERCFSCCCRSVTTPGCRMMSELELTRVRNIYD